MTRDQIIKDLKNQRKIIHKDPDKFGWPEWPSDIGLLLRVAEVCKTSSDWQAMADAYSIRYGKLSYETHRCYRPSALLRKLVKILGPEPGLFGRA